MQNTNIFRISPEGELSLNELSHKQFFGSSLIIPSEINGIKVTQIAAKTFMNHTEIKEVIFPDTLTAIHANAFEGCTQLNTVRFPSTMNIIADFAFSKCSSLENIKLPSGITNIGIGTFKDCISLSDVSLSNTINKIGPEAFMHCTSLKYIDIPDSVTAILSKAFFDCNNLKSINFSNELSRIDSWAFASCRELTSLNLPNCLKKIQPCTFQNCINLRNIILPSELEYIGESAFRKSGIENLYIPQGVEILNPYTFADCFSLKSIIAGGLNYIGAAVFENDKCLNEVIVSNANTLIDSGTFNESKTTNITIRPITEIIKLANKYNIIDKKDDKLNSIKYSVPVPQKNINEIVDSISNMNERNFKLIFSKFSPKLKDEIKQKVNELMSSINDLDKKIQYASIAQSIEECSIASQPAVYLETVK